jgi:putative aldouronate transport system substrate-binding protein
MRKVFAALVVLVVATGMSFASGGQATPAAAAGGKTNLTLLQRQEPVGGTNGWHDRGQYQFLSQKFNVTIDVTATSNDQWGDRYRITMASGDLPDFIAGVGGINEINQYGQDGLLYRADTLLSVMPNLKRFYEKYPASKAGLTAGDGHIYTIPGGYVDAVWYHGTAVRGDILRSAGFDVTKVDTFEDYTRAFTALRQATGKPPVSMRSGFYGMMRVPMWSAGLERRGMSFDDATKTWFYNFTNERAKAVLTWAAENYKLGNFHPDIMTMGEDVWEPAFANLEYPALISECVFCFAYGAENRTKATDPNNPVDFVALKPPKLNGVQYAWRQNSVGEAEVILSAKTTHAEVIGKMLDYFKTVQGHAEAVYGKEGTDWVMDGGLPRILYDVPGNEYAATLRQKGFTVKSADDYNTFWNTQWGYIKFPGDMGQQPYEIGSTHMAVNPKQTTDFDPKYKPVVTAPPLPNVTFTAAEQEEVNSLTNTLNTAAAEFGASIIVGNKSINDWPQFQAQLKQLGSDRLTALYNTAYKRGM